jgi:uncharacterized protein YjbI with pentapeptide repeats
MLTAEQLDAARQLIGRLPTKTDQIMVLWSALNMDSKPSIPDLVRTLADLGVSTTYQTVYGTLTRKGVSTEEISGRVKESAISTSIEHKKYVDTFEGLKEALRRTSRTITNSIQVVSVDLHDTDLYELSRSCGGVKDGIVFMHNLSFLDCDLTGSNLHNLTMFGVKFERCAMKRADLAYDIRPLPGNLGMINGYFYPNVLQLGTSGGKKRRTLDVYEGGVSLSNCILPGASCRGRTIRIKDCWMDAESLRGTILGNVKVTKQNLLKSASGFLGVLPKKGEALNFQKLSVLEVLVAPNLECKCYGANSPTAYHGVFTGPLDPRLFGSIMDNYIAARRKDMIEPRTTSSVSFNAFQNWVDAHKDCRKPIDYRLEFNGRTYDSVGNCVDHVFKDTDVEDRTTPRSLMVFAGEWVLGKYDDLDNLKETS